MKIKTDFVTNSSSSCFVCFIPANYVLSDDVLKAAIDEQIVWWDEDEDNPKTIEDYMIEMRPEVEECIIDLQDGKDIYKDNYGDGVDYRVYSVVDQIVSEEGLGLTSVETAGDGLDQIVGIEESKIIKILTENIDITDFFKGIVRKK